MAAELQRWVVDKPWLNISCLLGEGPFYEKQTGLVRFVDIKRKQMHWVSASAPAGTGLDDLRTITLDVCPTVTANIQGADPRERIAVGLKTGLAELDVKAGTYKMIQPFNTPDNERVRSNDGAADSEGRFWVGTMTDFGLGPFQPEGSLYRMDNSTKEEMLSDLTIPNTPGWSKDGKIMYVVHSSARQILAFDYEAASGAMSNQRIFYQHDGKGEPDGFRMDVEGNLWQAVYGEGRVLKITPEGQVVGEVLLPTPNTTCVQFVGTELLVTSAVPDAEEGHSGGAVFRVDVGVEGLDLYEFKA